MSQARRSIEGEVALVLGGGDGLGREVALGLGARGVRVMVAGGPERALGRVVGELTCGGATARHRAGDTTNAEGLGVIVAQTVEAFGKLTWVVVAEPTGELAPVFPHVTAPGGRLLVLGTGATVAGAVAHLSKQLGPNGGTCNGLVWTGGPEAETTKYVEMAAFLCSDAADGLTGQTWTVSG